MSPGTIRKRKNTSTAAPSKVGNIKSTRLMVYRNTAVYEFPELNNRLSRLTSKGAVRSSGPNR